MSAPGAVTTTPAAALSLREFFDGVRAGRLVVQRCPHCGALAVPPKVVCVECASLVWDRRVLSGDGEVLSFTVIRVPPARLTQEAPYVIAVVRMAEGVSLLGRLVGIPVDDARVGLPVSLMPPAVTDSAEPPILIFRVRDPGPGGTARV